LRKYDKTLVIVSHDREFLNDIVTDIIHIDDKKLKYYKGNYDGFVKLRDIENKKDNKEKKEKKIQFIFRNVNKVKIPVIQVKDISFSYDGEVNIFENLELNLDCDSKIAIVGHNGSGKSSLLKVIAKELHVTNGEVYHSPQLRIAKYSQHFVDQLIMTMTPIAYINSKFKHLKTQEVRNALGMFGLHGKTHEKPIELLSGGQKSRVCFCELSLTFPHVLFLDEPTNHLDIESVEALADSLNKFKGGVIFITHDLRLVSKVAKELWVCKGDKTVVNYDGTFEEYKQGIIDALDDSFI
jgi:ATP-binding cassette subfamily F protein 1